MGKTKEEKLAEFVKDGSVSKLRSFMRKHKRVDLNSVRLVTHSYQPLLHMACMAGNDSVARVLLLGGADPCLADTRGDTALHVALRRAIFGHEHAFEDLVCLLLRYCSDGVLDAPNKAGQTPRHLLKKYITEVNGKYGPGKVFANCEKEKEDEWNQKLNQAWMDDDLPDQQYYHGFDESPEEKQETFDQWADRLAKEYRQKRQKAEKTESNSNHKRSKRKGIEDESHYESKYESKSRKSSKKMIGKERKDHILVMKVRYENKLRTFQAKETGELSYDDIPWPCNSDVAEHMVQVLLGGVDKNKEEEFKRYLRTQQRVWHPDKFMQKYGTRLNDEDRGRIMERVKELSQELNAAGEDQKKGEFD